MVERHSSLGQAEEAFFLIVVKLEEVTAKDQGSSDTMLAAGHCATLNSGACRPPSAWRGCARVMEQQHSRLGMQCALMQRCPMHKFLWDSTYSSPLLCCSSCEARDGAHGQPGIERSTQRQ